MLKNIGTVMVLFLLVYSVNTVFCMKRSHQQACVQDPIAENSGGSVKDLSLHADKKKLGPDDQEIQIPRVEYHCLQANYKRLEKKYQDLNMYCSQINSKLYAENSQLWQQLLLQQQQIYFLQLQSAHLLQTTSESAHAVADTLAPQVLVSLSAKKPRQSKRKTKNRG